MGEAVAGTGLYDFREVEDLLHISPQMLARIAFPDPEGQRPPVVPAEHYSYFTFAEFVSIAVVVTLRKRQVPYPDILAAEQLLAERHHTRWPFAHRDALSELGTSGRDLLLGTTEMETAQGQRVLDEVAGIYLRRLTFDDDAHATSWAPVDGVVLDPEIQAGAPCLSGTRVPTAWVADLVAQGQVPEDVADDLDLELQQVVAALRFEDQLGDGLLVG